MADSIVIIKDDFSPWLQGVMDNAPTWKRKALKSLGWFMQKQIKEGIKSGAPGGQAYPKTIPLYVRQKLDKLFGNRLKNSYPILGRMAQAVGYQYKQTGDSVETGWLSESAANIGSIAEGGGERTVTDDMRYAFWAAGVPIGRSKDRIIIPARPTFGPMYRVLDPQLEPYMAGKIFQFMDEGTPAAGTNPRKYTVFK